jgi:hypothetical protein
LDLIYNVHHLIERGFHKREIVRELTQGKEHRIKKWFTLGDVSYKNMILAAMDVSLDEV